MTVGARGGGEPLVVLVVLMLRVLMLVALMLVVLVLVVPVIVQLVLAALAVLLLLQCSPTSRGIDLATKLGRAQATSSDAEGARMRPGH